MGGTPAFDPYVDEEEAAVGHNPSPSWSDLPSDILRVILQRLGLPEAVAFASVCTTWCSAATAAGIPCSCTPMIMSWRDILHSRNMKSREIKGSLDVTWKFRHILDAHKAYDASFPQGLCFVACCGSSHGWLFLVNELANLVLYNPFNSRMIHLPPITGFSCIEAVNGGKAYRFEKFNVHDAKALATWFYQKAVLSCSPSKSADYVVMIIHRDSNWLSFVRAGENKWKVASTLAVSRDDDDRYADCVYHNGRFYTITFQGRVEKWNLNGLDGPAKEVIVSKRHRANILTRNLVSTPWGDLLEVRAFPTSRRMYLDGVRFRVLKLDPDGCKEISRASVMTLLKEHAIFVGLNQSACLSVKNFPSLRGCCIYFTTPWMTSTYQLLRRCPGWGGVRTYDLERRTFEHVFPFLLPEDCRHRYYTMSTPSDVWITPNIQLFN